MQDFKKFVFLDGRGYPYAVMVLDENPWLCYWNEGQKCFTTLRQIDFDEVNTLSGRRLSDKYADMYFDYWK